MKFTAWIILVFLAAFTSTALASGAISAADPSLSDTAKAIFDAVSQGQWWVAAAYVVILGTIGARKLMPTSWKTGVKGDIIGTATAFAVAFAGAVATSAAAPGATMTLAVVATAAKIGLAAIGGYTLIHKVAGWLAAWGKLPPWALSLVGLLAMLVGSNAVKKAETAGAKAVEATPSTGVAGDTKIVEIE